MSDEINAVFSSWSNSFIQIDKETQSGSSMLLGHYTSLESAHSILCSKTIWLSNPLFMNDIQELRLGINMSTEYILSNIFECFDTSTARIVERCYVKNLQSFQDEQMIDIYVLCFCEHNQDDYDGVLSMWRGYGGYGGGVALVINTSFVRDGADLPIYIQKVQYISNEERQCHLKHIIDNWCQHVKQLLVPEDMLYIPVFYLFYIVLLNALTSKHYGFKEEREWRLLYIKAYDESALLTKYLSYHVDKHGIQPKLKLPIGPLPDDDISQWSIPTIVDRIIIGPSISSPLAQETTKRLLQPIYGEALNDKVYASGIPFRSK